MLIDNVVSLTFGVLENTPNVRDCYEIAFKSSDVRRGDLFIVRDSAGIDEAIANGAYALLYDADITIKDDEIAWIRVDDVDAAVRKILRHQLLELHVEIMSCETVCLNMIQVLNRSERLVVLNSTALEDIYKTFQKLSHHSLLLISESLLLTNIFPTCKSMEVAIDQKITLIEGSLFESSFLFNTLYYEKQRISPLLLPYLERSLNFFKSKNLDYTISKVSHLESFEPIFVNKALTKKEFGSTEQVIILENNLSLFHKAMLFLRERAPWSNITIMTPNTLNIIKYDNLNYESYHTSADIIEQLKYLEFNFVLVLHESSLKEFFSEERQVQQLTFAL